MIIEEVSIEHTQQGKSMTKHFLKETCGKRYSISRISRMRTDRLQYLLCLLCVLETQILVENRAEQVPQLGNSEGGWCPRAFDWTLPWQSTLLRLKLIVVVLSPDQGPVSKGILFKYVCVHVDHDSTNTCGIPFVQSHNLVHATA